MASPSPSSPILLLHPARLPLLLSLSRLAAADSRILSRRAPPALTSLTAAAKRISNCKTPPRSLPVDREGDGGAAVREDLAELRTDFVGNGAPEQGAAGAQQKRSAVTYDSLSLGIRESVYEGKRDLNTKQAKEWKLASFGSRRTWMRTLEQLRTLMVIDLFRSADLTRSADRLRSADPVQLSPVIRTGQLVRSADLPGSADPGSYPNSYNFP